MAIVIDLPDGDTAEVKDLDDLRDGDRKALNKVISVSFDAETEAGQLAGSYEDDQFDALLARVVLNWSLPLPLPSRDKRVLDKLTLAQAKALRAGVTPHYNLLMDKVDPTEHGTDPTNGSGS